MTLRPGIKAIALMWVCVAHGCSKPAGGAGGPPGAGGPKKPLAFPVEVQPVAARSVEFAVHAVGSVDAFEKVQVTTRVAGVVERVQFNEGQAIAQGQVLVEVEPDRFRVKVKQAKATVDRAAAARIDAETLLKRRVDANAMTPGLVPEDELDQYRGRARLAAADEASARAQLEEAELNLRDAVVRAPVAGLVEERLVRTGQYVQPGTPLASMVQREPLLLRFQVSPEEAQQIGTRQRVSFRVRDGRRAFTALVVHVGEMVAGASRLVPVLARVDDPDRRSLRPGTFAEVTVPVSVRTNAPVIPQTAVRSSERGFLAYVVIDGKATERVLELGLRTDDGLVEVRRGLEPGETLVVRGAEALREGAPVRIVEPKGAQTKEAAALPAPAPGSQVPEKTGKSGGGRP